MTVNITLFLLRRDSKKTQSSLSALFVWSNLILKPSYSSVNWKGQNE